MGTALLRAPLLKTALARSAPAGATWLAAPLGAILAAVTELSPWPRALSAAGGRNCPRSAVARRRLAARLDAARLGAALSRAAQLHAAAAPATALGSAGLGARALSALAQWRLHRSLGASGRPAPGAAEACAPLEAAAACAG